MATVQHKARRLAPQRYTISQLIQIARDAKYPFDLSKFTYDAARAGVVPPLGDIAVTSRRSSAQRMRGWSSESVEANSEVLSYSGNTTFATSANEPRRQPSGPPTEPKSQKDVGFAKFLKKHSSPNHNRVTTGGRIVPMEKRGSPPKFDLHQPRVSAELFQSGYKEEFDPSGALLTTPASLEVDDFTSADTQSIMSPASHLAANVVMPVPAGRDNASFMGAAMPVYGTQMQTNGFPVMAQFPGTPAYYYMPNPVHSGNPVYGAPSGWHLPMPTAGLMPERDRFDGVEPTTQLLITAQSCLSQAQTQYELLDRQLKAMDRHRAMGTHDPNLATQRMAVVQQRADVKAMVNRLSVQVDMLQNYKPQGAESPSGFAASARPFVPQSDRQKSPDTIRPRSSSESVEFTSEVERNHMEKSPVPAPRSRKIIPIIPPPIHDLNVKRKAAGTIQHANKESMWEVDQWGVRYRDSSNKSVGTVLHQIEPTKSSVPRSSIGAQTLATRKISKDIGTPPEIIEWKGGRPGPLPEELAGMTEVYYDALRLPVGVIAVFALANGDSFEVCGADLQPGGDSMTEKEQSYWRKKPAFTQQILKELRSKAQIIDGHLYNDDYLLGKPRQTNAGGFDVQDLLEEAMKVETDRREKAASAPQPDVVLVGSDNMMEAMDDLSNKGLSSVSIQDIHATVRLPPSFDGTTDSGRRDAKTVLTATNKNRSPRVLHRSAPNGGAWYGPHCRKVVS